MTMKIYQDYSYRQAGHRGREKAGGQKEGSKGATEEETGDAENKG